MTTGLDVLNAVNAMLVGKWPERKVYRGYVPKDFTRPCFLLRMDSETVTSANRGLVRVQAYFDLVCFTEADEYGLMDAGTLEELQAEVLKLFRRAKLPVGDRYIAFAVSAGGLNEGLAFIDMQVEYLDARGVDETEAPLMAAIETTIETEEK